MEWTWGYKGGDKNYIKNFCRETSCNNAHLED
jgi:hypothetical protein